MARLWLAFAVVGTGCFDPVLTPGQPCAPPPDRCPGALVCVDEICVEQGGPGHDAPVAHADARVDGAPGVDSDGDGVFDDVDNCVAVANPGQYDEDGDGSGNPCDVCPYIAGSLDTDGDGVGDDCDPSPAVPGDAWVAFYGFDDASEIAGWTGDPGWTVSAGKLASPNDVLALSRTMAPGAIADAYAVTTATFVEVDPDSGATYRSAAVLTAATASGEYRCIVRDTPSTMANGAVLRDSTTLQQEDLTGSVAGAVSLLALEDVGNSLSCTGLIEAQAWSVATTDNNRGGGMAGVRVQHAIASFSYLAVVLPGS